MITIKALCGGSIHVNEQQLRVAGGSSQERSTKALAKEHAATCCLAQKWGGKLPGDQTAVQPAEVLVQTGYTRLPHAQVLG
jgi:hypothetical protein